MSDVGLVIAPIAHGVCIFIVFSVKIFRGKTERKVIFYRVNFTLWRSTWEDFREIYSKSLKADRTDAKEYKNSVDW